MTHTCKVCGKTEAETKFYYSRGKLRATCGPCKSTKTKAVIRAGMDMHKESIRNLMAAKSWTTTSEVAKTHKLTTASVRTGFARLVKAGLLERRRVEVPKQSGRGGLRLFDEFKQTQVGIDWLTAYHERMSLKVKKAKEPEEAAPIYVNQYNPFEWRTYVQPFSCPAI